jgi:hypothetical protein
MNRLLTAFFDPEPFELEGRSAAQVNQQTFGCILGLRTAGGPGARITLSGSTVDVFGCEVLSNTELEVNAAATLTTDCVRTRLAYFARGTVNVLQCENGPFGSAGITLDPYIDRPEPNLTSVSCGTTQAKTINTVSSLPSPTTLSDGTTAYVFCHDATISRSIVLPSGLYVFRGGNLYIGEGYPITVSGTDISFFFSNGSVGFSWPSTVLQLGAPALGPHAGMLFRGARTNTGLHSLSSAPNSIFDGAFYFPGARLIFSATGNIGGCLQLIASEVQVSGQWRSTNGPCEGPGTRPIVASRAVLITQ